MVDTSVMVINSMYVHGINDQLTCIKGLIFMGLITSYLMRNNVDICLFY